MPDAFDRAMGAIDAAESLCQGLGFRRPAGSSDREGDDPLLSVFKRQRRLKSSARIVSRSNAPRETYTPHGRRAGHFAIAAEKLGAVAGEIAVGFTAIEESYSITEFWVVHVASENCAASGIGLRNHMQQRLAPRIAEDQFPIAGHRHLPWTSRMVGD